MKPVHFAPILHTVTNYYLADSLEMHLKVMWLKSKNHMKNTLVQCVIGIQ